MILKAMPKRDFRISVKQYAPRSLMTKCPGTPPIWVTNLVSGGSNMSLAGVMVQAGRHFADSLNMEVFSGNATRRQEATKLAWMLVAMIRPELNEEFLEINDPGDGDIKRLASEILGVGAALELLRIQGAIDARTIRKISTRFDYEANAFGGAGRVLIEAKGTSNCSTIHEHRKSFASKIASLSKQGATRGYSRAIGIIFSTWTKGSPRGIDVEIMDPEGKKESLFEESVREIIKFYARRFDETAGLPEAAERLYRLASYDLLFQANSPISEYVGADTVSEHIFNRSSFVFALRSKPRTFWGTFWESRAVPCPLPSDEREVRGYTYAYTGIDSDVIRCLRERRFADLLSFGSAEDHLFAVRENGFSAQFLLDKDGVLRGWMNQIPEEIRFEIE